MRRTAGNLSKIFLSSLLVITFWACDEDKYNNGETPEIRPLTAEEKFLIQSSNDFAADLLNDKNQTSLQNVSLSPVSAAMALGMIGNAGTQKDFEEFKTKMGLPQLNEIEINKAFYEVSNMLPHIDKAIKIDFTNSIWTNYDLSVNEDYYNKVMAYLKTDIWEFREEKLIDKKLVDRWLMNKSNNYINSITNYDLQSNFKIINLSTFSGKMFAGVPSQWVISDFHTVKGETKALNMNFYNDVPVNSYQSGNILSVEIPLGNSNYFLSIIVPDSPNSAIDFSQFANPVNVRNCNLLIPDIRASYEYSLGNKFKEFGAEHYLNSALVNNFSGQSLNANLSGINKTQIDITGVKLNADSPVELSKLSFNGGMLKIDKPFYYLVKEKNTDLIVFEGKFFQIDN